MRAHSSARCFAVALLIGCDWIFVGSSILRSSRPVCRPDDPAGRDLPVSVTAKAKIDLSLRQFPKAYWKYLLATGLFGMAIPAIPF